MCTYNHLEVGLLLCEEVSGMSIECPDQSKDIAASNCSAIPVSAFVNMAYLSPVVSSAHARGDRFKCRKHQSGSAER